MSFRVQNRSARIFVEPSAQKFGIGLCFLKFSAA